MSLFSLQIPFWNLPHHSRIHPIKTLSSVEQHVFIKREDELGVLSLGTKLRKYLSLLPFLQKSVHEIALFGSPNSNQMLALSLLLRESAIPFSVFLQGKKPQAIQGNYLLSSLLWDKEKTFWIPKEMSFEDVVAHWESVLKKPFTWVPQGASCKHSLPGALTLAEDILRNEQLEGIVFDHIFVDAGTGFTAAALLLGLGHLKRHPQVYIAQLAGGDLEVFMMLEECKTYFKALYGQTPPLPPFEVIRPRRGKSFGSLTEGHLDFIKDFAKQEGVFLDPIYNAKLFSLAKEKIKQDALKGNILIIESGGTFSLSGFSSHLVKRGSF